MYLSFTEVNHLQLLTFPLICWCFCH